MGLNRRGPGAGAARRRAAADADLTTTRANTIRAAPGLQNIDFRKTVTRLNVPVYFVQGRYEVRGRAEPFAQWFKMLNAPSKQMIIFATSGHQPLFEQPRQFRDFMVNTVLR